jgi:hypothetical protein
MRRALLDEVSWLRDLPLSLALAALSAWIFHSILMGIVILVFTIVLRHLHESRIVAMLSLQGSRLLPALDGHQQSQLPDPSLCLRKGTSPIRSFQGRQLPSHRLRLFPPSGSSGTLDEAIRSVTEQATDNYADDQSNDHYNSSFCFSFLMAMCSPSHS